VNRIVYVYNESRRSTGIRVLFSTGVLQVTREVQGYTGAAVAQYYTAPEVILLYTGTGDSQGYTGTRLVQVYRSSTAVIQG